MAIGINYKCRNVSRPGATYFEEPNSRFPIAHHRHLLLPSVPYVLCHGYVLCLRGDYIGAN